MTAPGGNGASPYAGDWDPDEDPDGAGSWYDDEEKTPLPDFGCACQNALVVDTVCWSCISYLAEQERTARSEPGDRSERREP